MDHRKISIESLAQGAAGELFDAALEEVLKNIEDPSTDFKPTRKLMLEFTFTCDEERAVGHVEVRCATKLAGIRSVRRTLYYGRLDGRLMAVEQPSQQQLFPTPNGTPKLVEDPPAASGESR